MSQQYEIVRYSPEFKDQIVKLQTHNWGPDLALNAAYLEWKYERNPYQRVPLIHLALCGGAVVGMRALFGAMWEVGTPSQTVLAPCASDLVIAPAHRNRGLLSRMTVTAVSDLADSDHKYILNLSPSPITYVSFLAMGWRDIAPLETMHWETRRGAVLRHVFGYSGWLHALSPAFRRARAAARKRVMGSSPRQSRAFASLDFKAAKRGHAATPNVAVDQRPRPEAMAELVDRIGSDGRMRHVRDLRYFTWRFQNPRSAYRFLFWQGARLEGYLILRRALDSVRNVVSIVDWEATDAQVRADLLQAAITWGNFAAMNIWSATFPDEVKALLGRSGFKHVDAPTSIARTRPAMLVRPVCVQVPPGEWVVADRRLLDLSSWDLRMIYSDGS